MADADSPGSSSGKVMVGPADASRPPRSVEPLLPLFTVTFCVAFWGGFSPWPSPVNGEDGTYHFGAAWRSPTWRRWAPLVVLQPLTGHPPSRVCGHWWVSVCCSWALRGTETQHPSQPGLGRLFFFVATAQSGLMDMDLRRGSMMGLITGVALRVLSLIAKSVLV